MEMLEIHPQQHSLITIFSVWNTMMGTSLLSIPWALSQSGLSLGILIVLLFAAIALYSCYRILKSPEHIGKDLSIELPEVCEFYFARTGRWLCLIFSVLVTSGVLVVYWVLMSNFLYSTGEFIYHRASGFHMTDTTHYGNTSTPVWCATALRDRNKGFNNHAVCFAPGSNSTAASAWVQWWHLHNSVPFYLIILVLPMMNFRSAMFFSKFNNMGIVSVIYLIIMVTVKAAQWGIHVKGFWIRGDGFFVAEFNKAFPIMSGVMMLGFFIHNCIITLMRNNTATKNVRDLCIAYLLVSLTYLYIGVLFFISFPTPPVPKSCIAQNLLDNLPIGDLWGVIGRLLLLFQLMTVYPILVYVIRVQLFQALYGNIYPSFFHVFALNLSMVAIGSLTAKFYPNIGNIIRYSGAVCGLFFIFILPYGIHLIYLQQKGQRTVFTTIFHVSLVILGVANLIGQFLM